MVKPKICVLFCGGTIVMKKDGRTGSLDVADGVVAELMNLEPRLKENYDMEVVFLDNIDSTEMEPDNWGRIADAVGKNYEKYDGFVVTHGTNTMGYTSSALSFALQGIGKPVVLTGAQIPLSEPESDARRNFINAVKVAGMNLSGVMVVFGSKIITGARAKKVSESDIDAFKTFNGDDLGEIGIQMRLKGVPQKKHSRPFAPKSSFGGEIAVITLEPGMTLKQMEWFVKSGIDGLVIRAYGSGDIPTRLVPALELAREKEIPVLVTTQCPNGVTQLGLNAAGFRATQAGVTEVFDMSMESMTTKLHWLLGQKTPYSKIKKLMQENLCNEIAPREEQNEEA